MINVSNAIQGMLDENAIYRRGNYPIYPLRLSQDEIKALQQLIRITKNINIFTPNELDDMELINVRKSN